MSNSSVTNYREWTRYHPRPHSIFLSSQRGLVRGWVKAEEAAGRKEELSCNTISGAQLDNRVIQPRPARHLQDPAPAPVCDLLLTSAEKQRELETFNTVIFCHWHWNIRQSRAANIWEESKRATPRRVWSCCRNQRQNKWIDFPIMDS